jgi:hypothetical protein
MIKYREWDWQSQKYNEKIVGVGTTLYVRSESERVMSDVWDYVTRVYYWDTDESKIRSVFVDENVEYTFDANMEELLLKIYEDNYMHFLDIERRNAEADAMVTNVRGRFVQVTRGRSHKGQKGKVVVAKQMAYNAGYRSYMTDKLGIALDDEMGTYVAKNGKTYPTHKNMIWAWAQNCEVIAPEPDYEKTVAVAAKRASIVCDDIKAFHKNSRNKILQVA